jgi:hypothetical protein
MKVRVLAVVQSRSDLVERDVRMSNEVERCLRLATIDDLPPGGALGSKISPKRALTGAQDLRDQAQVRSYFEEE